MKISKKEAQKLFMGVYIEPTREAYNFCENNFERFIQYYYGKQIKKIHFDFTYRRDDLKLISFSKFKLKVKRFFRKKEVWNNKRKDRINQFFVDMVTGNSIEYTLSDDKIHIINMKITKEEAIAKNAQVENKEKGFMIYTNGTYGFGNANSPPKKLEYAKSPVLKFINPPENKHLGQSFQDHMKEECKDLEFKELYDKECKKNKMAERKYTLEDLKREKIAVNFTTNDEYNIMRKFVDNNKSILSLTLSKFENEKEFYLTKNKTTCFYIYEERYVFFHSIDECKKKGYQIIRTSQLDFEEKKYTLEDLKTQKIVVNLRTQEEYDRFMPILEDPKEWKKENYWQYNEKKTYISFLPRSKQFLRLMTLEVISKGEKIITLDQFDFGTEEENEYPGDQIDAFRGCIAAGKFKQLVQENKELKDKLNKINKLTKD